MQNTYCTVYLIVHDAAKYHISDIPHKIQYRHQNKKQSSDGPFQKNSTLAKKQHAPKIFSFGARRRSNRVCRILGGMPQPSLMAPEPPQPSHSLQKKHRSSEPLSW